MKASFWLLFAAFAFGDACGRMLSQGRLCETILLLSAWIILSFFEIRVMMVEEKVGGETG